MSHGEHEKGLGMRLDQGRRQGFREEGAKFSDRKPRPPVKSRGTEYAMHICNVDSSNPRSALVRS